MADESVDTASTGLPSSVAETEPDWGNLLPVDENQSMRGIEEAILGMPEQDVASETNVDEDTSTPAETAAPEDETASDQSTEEDAATTEDESTEEVEETTEETTDDEETEQTEEIEETVEQKLARLEKENAELQKRVSGNAKKASPRDRQAERIATLEAKLQDLAQQKVEAERKANLKPYHQGHPDYGRYQQQKERVKIWMQLRNEAQDDPDFQTKVDRSLAALGLTDQDVRLVQEGEAYEAEHARRFATDPQYRRQVMQQDFEAIQSQQLQRQQAVAYNEKMMNDEENQRLMNEYQDEFDRLWDDPRKFDLGYIFAQLGKLDAETKLKQAIAQGNREKASKQAKANIDRKKAAHAAETNPEPDDGPKWAADYLVDIKKEYKEKYGQSFNIDRIDCMDFMNRWLANKQIRTNDERNNQ